MKFKTADLCDAFADRLQVAGSEFAAFGARRQFHGPVRTVRVERDFLLVKQCLEQPGEDCVLVVDNDGAPDCAVFGDRLAALASRNGWAGVIVNGCVRDVEDIAVIDIGVRALGTFPRRGSSEGRGELDVPVVFAGITFEPGSYVYVDADGVLVSEAPLSVDS